MFPFDIEDDIELEVEEEKEPCDYEIDFESGKLTGRLLTGLDAIKQSIKIRLSTDRYYYNQYTWNHGNELSSLIGQNYNADYMQSEVTRMIEDALLPDENINSIEDVSYSFENDKLTVSFTAVTDYGKAVMNV